MEDKTDHYEKGKDPRWYNPDGTPLQWPYSPNPPVANLKPKGRKTMNAEGGCEFEFTAGVTCVECNQLEDEEDIKEGLKALADEEGTVGWQKYQKKRGE